MLLCDCVVYTLDHGAGLPPATQIPVRTSAISQQANDIILPHCLTLQRGTTGFLSDISQHHIQ